MIFQLFKSDLKRIFSNTISCIIVLGLVLLPSIFSWYNVLACWDVFDNTDNLKVAIANNDAGYESDLVPLKLNLGEQVQNALRENAQMDWVFTDEEDAIDGTESGKYYAAVVIPESFSKDMMTFYSGDTEHAKLIYYSNEKKNVVAPKLTDQGASKASVTVNEVFSETLAELGLNIASSLLEYTDSTDATGQLGKLANHVDTLGDQLDSAGDTLDTYAEVLDATQQLVSSSSELLAQAGTSASEVMDSAEDAKDSVSTISDALTTASDSLGEAISSSAVGYEGLSSSIDAAFDSAGNLSDSSASSLEAQVDTIQKQVKNFRAVASKLRVLADSLPDASNDLKSAADRLESSADAQEKLADSLTAAAKNIRQNKSDVASDRAEVTEQAKKAQQSVSQLSSDYNSDIKPKLESLSSDISSMASTLSGSASTLTSAGKDLEGSADSLSSKIASSKQGLQDAAKDLKKSSKKMNSLAASMKKALASGDMDELREVLSADTDSLAAALAAPVKLERTAVFPADNFGSQMAPLYTTLALWIGSLLLAVAIKVNVSLKAQAELGYLKLRQLFLGRFGVFALLSFMQSTVLAVGNMLFLQLQVSDPLLYLICYWVSGLVFTFIIYTLVVSFANLGKAIAVLLLILQVTAGGGSFPLQVLPDFFQWLSPFMPATHTINAMRAAMMGVYQNDFWIEIGALLLFVIPFLLLGLVLRKPLMRFLNWYVRKAEESKIVC